MINPNPNPNPTWFRYDNNNTDDDDDDTSAYINCNYFEVNEFSEANFEPNKSFSIFHMNIHSIQLHFDELKLIREFSDKFNENTAGINVYNGIIQGGKDDKKPLFEKRTYQLKK